MEHPAAETILTATPGPLRLPLPWVVAWCGSEVAGDLGAEVAMTGEP